MKKNHSIASGTPFDTLMRGLVHVSKDDLLREEKKLAAAKAKRTPKGGGKKK